MEGILLAFCDSFCGSVERGTATSEIIMYLPTSLKPDRFTEETTAYDDSNLCPSVGTSSNDDDFEHITLF